jgi:hypothetical protein
MAEEMVFVFSDGELRVLQTWNLSVGVGRRVARVDFLLRGDRN